MNFFDSIHNNSGNQHFQNMLARAFENPSQHNILRGGVRLAPMLALLMLPG